MMTTELSRKNVLSPDASTVTDARPDLICFSHLRWDFVFQRPQHLLTRLSKTYNIYFIEEPVFHASQSFNHISGKDNITVVVPHVAAQPGPDAIAIQRNLVNELIAEKSINDYTLWYYTPMALEFSDHLEPAVTIYDCMDELSAFRFAPSQLQQLETTLLEKADVVFTGGYSLYNAKKHRHANIHPFPSSVDKKHFGKARSITVTPGDQTHIAAPRIGFFGVIDERFDAALIDSVAERQPGWHFVIIGPVVKIDPATLPRRDNIHYLGSKSYGELPDYISGWDIAMIPFQLNESTVFISPTKTPEYLSAGVPVISTPIKDVIEPYGVNGLVSIASSADEFIAAAENILYRNSADRQWLQQVDDFLSNDSWDITVEKMLQKIEEVAQQKNVNS